jgi:hypothetical protein
MTQLRRLAVLVVGLSLGWSATAQADPVTYWNGVTLSAVTAGRPGPPGLLDIALVQSAVHDAVQAIEGRFEPYHYKNRAQRGVGSPAAAVAAAAHRALVLLYPTQQVGLDAIYSAYLSDNALTGDAALAVGEAAAAALHADHYRPTLPVTPFFGGTEIGEWRSPVPLAFLFLAHSEPFTLKRVDQFRPQPPPPLRSRTYARDYAEVKELGEVSAHPNPNTDVARFWSVNFVAQWNESLRQIADNYVPRLGDRARLFALANLAAADAAMATWDSKYFYNFWRPSTGIQEGGYDGNFRTSGDPGWTPLLADPPYPDYVSGANGLTGAFTGLLRLFFGTDKLDFTVKTTSPLVVDAEREYERFSQAAQEVVDARVLLGIHFRFADEEGRRLGERVAHWTFQKYLRPVHHSKK